MESSSTNRVVDLLTVWTVENGSITCFGTIVTLTCWLTRTPSNRIFLSLLFCVPKLYANSFFATLNARIKIHNYLHKGTASNQLRPSNILPESVFEEGDKERGPPNPMRGNYVDQYTLQPAKKTYSQSKLEVSVSRTVENDCESGVDSMWWHECKTNISEFGRGGRGAVSRVKTAWPGESWYVCNFQLGFCWGPESELDFFSCFVSSVRDLLHYSLFSCCLLWLNDFFYVSWLIFVWLATFLPPIASSSRSLLCSLQILSSIFNYQSWICESAMISSQKVQNSDNALYAKIFCIFCIFCPFDYKPL